MRKIKILATALVCIVALACHERSDSVEYPVLEVDVDKSSKGVDDLFSRVRIIPLEERDGLYLKYIDKVKLCNDTIYVYDSSQTIVSLFTLSGELIGQINRVGRSREEYVALSDFEIDEKTGNLLLLDPTGRIKEYDNDGSFVRDIELPHPPYNYHHISLLDATTAAVWSSTDDNSNAVNFINIDSGEFTPGFFSNTGVWASFRGGTVFHKYNNETYYHESLSGKVYRVTPQKVDVAYEWDLGVTLVKDKILQTPIQTPEQHKSLIDSYRGGEITFSFIRQMQSDSYYCSTTITGDFRLTTYLYDKESGKTTIIEDDEQGLFRFAPEYITDEYLLGVVCSRDNEAFLRYAQEQNYEIINKNEDGASQMLIQLFF